MIFRRINNWLIYKQNGFFNETGVDSFDVGIKLFHTSDANVPINKKYNNWIH